MKRYTREQWLAMARSKFGEDQHDWAFRCPFCGFVQNARLFLRFGVEVKGSPYKQCLGRFVPWIGGCDYSLIHSLVRMPHDTEVYSEASRAWVPVFEFAEYSPAVELPPTKEPEPARLYRLRRRAR